MVNGLKTRDNLYKEMMSYDQFNVIQCRYCTLVNKGPARKIERLNLRASSLIMPRYFLGQAKQISNIRSPD